MRKAEESNPTPVKTHTRFERGLAPSPVHLPDDDAAEGGGLEPHTWRCRPGSSRRRRLAGSPSIVVHGGSRTRTPERAPRFERGVSTVPATWTSQCPGRESNSHAQIERRLLRPVCLPVVPPPGRELRESDSNRRPPGYEPGDLPPDLSRDELVQRQHSVPGGTRTPALLVRNQALSSTELRKHVEPVGIEPTTAWVQTRCSPD
jgi:hypothetical protein